MLRQRLYLLVFLIFVSAFPVTTFHTRRIKYRMNLYDVYHQHQADGNARPMQYDCLYYDVIDHLFSTRDNWVWSKQLMTFCFRPDHRSIADFPANGFLNLPILNHQNYTFVQLKENSVSSNQLFDWSASIDLIEYYQAFLDGEMDISLEDSQLLSMPEYHFYNCTPPWFGFRCQYYFGSVATTLEEYVYDTYSLVYSLYPPDASCYVHLTCDRGSQNICLDWREICDGKNDCLNSEDERDCFELEANQCDEKEYRCHGGQCIPLQFYRDDIFNPDCMDRTDEEPPMSYVEKCSTDLTFRCEESSCYPQIETFQTYSCGDGQCVFLNKECYNMRHTYMEIPEPDFSWTDMEHGCFIAMSCLTGLAAKGYNCNCREQFGISCISLMTSECPAPLFLFPATPVVLGHIYYIYNKTKVDRQKILMTPMYVCFAEEYCAMKNVIQYKIFNRACIDYNREFGKYFPVYPGWGTMNALMEDYFQAACPPTKNGCLYSSLYQCDHSLKCISTDRLLDGINNCPLGDDERKVHRDFLNETNKYRFKCPDTDFSVSPLVLNDGMFDCPYGEDEIDPNQRYLQRNIRFKFICDGIQDLLPINVNGKNMTDETDCEQWPCNNSYTHCDSIWNCPKGEDEFECKDVAIRCSPLHHPCISSNATSLFCLSIEKIHDGIIDCIGGSDERQMCRETDPYDHQRRYHCWNENDNDCQLRIDISACDTEIDRKFRPFGSNRFRCSQNNVTAIQKYLCTLEDKRDYEHSELPLSNLQSIKLERNYSYNEISTPHHFDVTSRNTKLVTDSCFRGIPIHVASENGILAKCLCPPSAYGEHCEYQNQRVSLTAQAKSASDWRSIFTFIFILMSDENEVESYEYRYYSPSTDCAVKWNIYLLYRSRPKDSTKNYSVRVDIYKQETNALEYRTSWHYPIKFAFLPVYRLAIEIIIPTRKFVNDKTTCTLDCHGHGSCILANLNTKQERALCRCDPGWIGNQCQYSQVPLRKCSCAPGSVCISIHPTLICVCPLHRSGPRCYIKLNACQNSSECLNEGQCVSHDERRHSDFAGKCICQKDFWGERCELPITKLIVVFHTTIPIPFLILVHLIKDKQVMQHQHATTFKRILPYETSPITIRTTVTEFDLAFVEFANSYYFTSFKNDHGNEILMLVSPANRCQSIDKLFNSSFAQLHLIQRIKYYQIPCQKHANLACFYDDIHICVCNLDRYAVCILFEHKKTYICQADSGNCENGGKCFQDSVQCPTMSACLCPDCFYGSKCQFSSKGFSLSLDSIIGYQIRPVRSLQTQLFVIKFSITVVCIMFTTGLVNGFLSTLVFIRKDARKVGCGLYLLTISLFSIVIVIMLVLKLSILLLAQMTYITNMTFLHIQCRSIDYILRTCLNVSDWLSACVAVERVVSVNQGARFSTTKSKQIAKCTIIVLCIIVAISNLHEIIYHQLITDDNEQRTWCVGRYSSSIQKYNAIIQVINFLIPFICNIISALVIIYKIAQQRFLIQSQETLQQHIHKQIIDLKRLIISPVMLVLLASPRLIISLLSDCIKSERDPWLFLVGYFISFPPSILVIVVFILPSETYKSECKKLLISFYQKLC